jgi:hypothetical protein
MVFIASPAELAAAERRDLRLAASCGITFELS